MAGQRGRPAAGQARRDGRSRRRRAAGRSVTATTAIRSSRCSRRRAAATSPPRASCATARSRRGPTTACSPGIDDGAVAAAERRVGTGRVIALDDDARRLAGTTSRSSRSTCRSSISSSGTSRGTSSRRRGARSARSSICPTPLKSRADRVVVTPAAERITRAARASRACSS